MEEGSRVVVMGLGRFGGGVGVARWLAGRGARVLVTDQADADTLSRSLERLADIDVEVRCGPHTEDCLEGADLLVVSPAVNKARSEFVALARQKGIPITSEMNLFVQHCPGRIVGVTGTVGKSTVCAMLHAVLDRGRTTGELDARRVWLGGNIGVSLLERLAEMHASDVVVLEMSSYQLEDLGTLGVSPPLAIITNVVPNHLERHGNLGSYLDAKLNICRRQRPGDAVVLGTDNPDVCDPVKEIAAQTGASVVHAPPDCGFELRVPGMHNRQNAALAVCAAGLLGVSRETAQAALAEFPGLAHRICFVRQVAGVDYYNDAKSTTPSATAAAVRTFIESGPETGSRPGREVVLLLGGAYKDVDWTPLAEVLRQKQAQVVCYGQSGTALAQRFGGRTVETVEQGVEVARRLARPDQVVLLSPGCPSHDQFVNYEARGDAFVQAVDRL